MKIQVSVYDGAHVGTAWCDIPTDIPLEVIQERYVLPSFAAAIDACVSHRAEAEAEQRESARRNFRVLID